MLEVATMDFLPYVICKNKFNPHYMFKANKLSQK